MAVATWWAGIPVASALGVSPTIIELQAAPGSSSHGAFAVTNETGAPIVVTVEIEAMGPSGYAGRDLSKWLAVSPAHLELAPGQSQDVAYTIAVPTGESGELAAEVVFVQNVGAGSVQVRFGMAVYMSIKGTERLDLAIEEMALRRSREGLASAWLRIANHGNIHCRPEGQIRVWHADGTLMSEQAMIRGMPVPPGGTSSFQVEFPSLRIDPGTYDLEAELSCYARAGIPVTLRAKQAATIGVSDEHTDAASTGPSVR